MSTPTIIRLLDAEGKLVQDSISGEYEDSFCLESFEDLCKAHFAAEPKNTKCFIIARVQTVDPKQPDKEFYSYYNAFHLNKTLFQTQIYLKKRYIHRLHVLNPLTNSDIIGSVQYYMVKPPKVAETVVVEVADPVIPTADAHIAENAAASAAPSSTVASPATPLASRTSVRKMSVIYTQQQNPVDSNIALASDGAGDGGAEQKKDLVINMHQVQFEDPTEERQAPDLMKKLGMVLSPAKEIHYRRNTLTSHPVTNFGQSQSPRKKRSNTTELQVTSMTPQGQLSVGGMERKVAQMGEVTRFAVPVPKEEIANVVPKTQRGTRRSLSYRNAVSASGVPASFLEWAKMVTEEYTDSKSEPASTTSAVASTGTANDDGTSPANAEGQDTINYDKVVFGGSRASRASRPSRISIPKPYHQMSPVKIATPTLNTIKDEDEDAGSPRAEIVESKLQDTSQKDGPGTVEIMPLEDGVEGKDPEKVVEEEDEEEEEVKLTVYDATFFATDTDFLETSKTRQIFRNNAIQPEDAKLFEMKEFTGTENTPQEFEIIRDTFPCECCYPSEQEMARMTPCSRFLHSHKCMILASLIALLIIVFIMVMMLQNLLVNKEKQSSQTSS